MKIFSCSCHVSVTEKKLILYMFLCVCAQTEEKEDEEEEALVGEVKASPNADTTILFVKGEGDTVPSGTLQLWFILM